MTKSNNLTVPAQRIHALISTDAVRKRFDDMLGKRSASFLSSIVSAVTANQSLSECEPMSVIQAAAIAASMDLPINSNLGFAHIVPYKGRATFQMGWKGFVQLAMRTGKYKTMNAAKVFEGQLVRLDPFTGEMEFNPDEKKSDTVFGYLFYFKLLNGFEKYTFMTTAQCEEHGKRYSQTYKLGKGRWKDDFDAMALKTVVKQGLSKWGILSVEIQQAMEFDQAAIDADGKPEFVDRPPEENEHLEPGPNRLKKLLGQTTPSNEVGAEPDAGSAPATPSNPEAGSFDEYLEKSKNGRAED